MIKRFDNLNAFHIFNDHTVDVVVRLHIGCVLTVVIAHQKCHRDHRQDWRDQNGKPQSPVDHQHPGKNRKGQQQIRRQLRDHVCQRRLYIVDLVHDDIFQIADSSSHDFAERRPHQSICNFQPKTFQYGISGNMCQDRRDAKANHANKISSHTHQTPKLDIPQCDCLIDKQDQNFIHRPERNKTTTHAQDGAENRQDHFSLAGACKR